MDDVDLTPAPLVLDPGEQRVADAVRGALGAPAPGPGLLAGVQRRAARRHRGARAAGVLGAGALVLAGLVVALSLSGTGADEVALPAAGGVPSAPLASAMLTPQQLAVVAPDAVVVTEQEGRTPSPPLGGWCDDVPLVDVAPAPFRDTAWAQDATGTRSPVSVEERVLRWRSLDDASAFTAASAESQRQCLTPGGAGGTYSTQVNASSRDPVRAIGLQAVTGPGSGWDVRAIGAADDGVTVVQLRMSFEAATSDDAFVVAGTLLDLAVDQAVDDGVR